MGLPYWCFTLVQQYGGQNCLREKKKKDSATSYQLYHFLIVSISKIILNELKCWFLYHVRS